MAIFGAIIFYMGLINTAWVLIIYIITGSATLGAKISKKVGTSNDKTDSYIDQGKSFSNDMLVKIIYRSVITLIGYLMMTFL